MGISAGSVPGANVRDENRRTNSSKNTRISKR
ncbi:uncharacterized protein METZ01_LOCUS204052, partial [marine metagenome]